MQKFKYFPDFHPIFLIENFFLPLLLEVLESMQRVQKLIWHQLDNNFTLFLVFLSKIILFLKWNWSPISVDLTLFPHSNFRLNLTFTLLKVDLLRERVSLNNTDAIIIIGRLLWVFEHSLNQLELSLLPSCKNIINVFLEMYAAAANTHSFPLATEITWLQCQRCLVLVVGLPENEVA